MASRRRVLGAIAGITSSLSGCAGDRDESPTGQGKTNTTTQDTETHRGSPTDEPTPEVKEEPCEDRWEPTTHWSYLDGTRVYPPAVLAGQAIFATWNGQLHAADVATGERLWTSDRYAFGGAAITNGSVVAIPDEDGLSTFTPNGEERWRIEPPDDRHRIRATASHGDTLYLSVSVSGAEIPRSEEYDRVYALDWGTGEQRWVVSVGSSEGHSPALDLRATENHLFAAVTGGYTVALSAATGGNVWNHDTKAGAERLVLAGDIVVRLADDALGLSPDSGAVRWRQSLDEEDLAGGAYAYGQVNDTLVALDPERGEAVWRVRLPGSGEMSDFATFGDTLYVTIDDELYALDASTGCRLGSVTAGSGLAVTDDRLIAAGLFSVSGVRSFSRP